MLESLIHKSLLRHKEGVSSEARFLLLEPVREYASLRLLHSAQADLFVQRHAAYYLTLAEQAAGELSGWQQDVWFCQLEHEHDNIRIALRTFLERGEAETALRLCAALEVFWYGCGHQREGRLWLERVLAYDTLSEAGRAKALDEAGGLAWMQGDYTQARALAEQSLALWQALGNIEGIAEALNTLGLVAESQGDLDTATAVHRQGLALRRTLDNPRRIAVALGNLGDVELYQQPPALESSIAHFKESLDIYQSLEDRRGMADMLVSLGDAALFQQDYERAAAQFRQSLMLYGQVAHANRNRILRCLERLPLALAMLGQPERAACLLGASDELRSAYDIPRSPIYHESYQRTMQVVRLRCGDAAFTSALAQGAALPLDQAISAALHSTLSPVTLCRWHAEDIAHWQQTAPTADDTPAARMVLVSPLAEPLAPCHTVIPSWQGHTPPGTWLEIHLHALIGTRWTRSYRLASWDTAVTQSQRRSFAAQQDADGWVDTDTLRLNSHAQAVQARVLLCSERADIWPELHHLALCLSARSPDMLYGERRNLSSTPVQHAKTLAVPAFSQYAYPQGAGWCSPTALAMVLGYWYQQTGDHRLQPFCVPDSVPTLAAALVDDPAYGTGNWSFNTAYAASLGLEAYVTQMCALQQVTRWVAAGVPVICSLAWEEGDVQHASMPRSDGHLVVVCGVQSDGHIIVADPAGADAPEVHRVYADEEFAACWQRHSAGTVYLIYPPAWEIPAPYPGDAWR
jgi:tetratricopeptide (TPR) repeat protein